MKEAEAIELLRKYIPEPITFRIILNHAKAVQKLAVMMARGIPGVDMELIKIGSLLHDIGRYKCQKTKQPAYKHGIIGAEILRKEGYEAYALIAERHLGAGISKADIAEQKLDLPKKDFVPLTKEEKIITNADNLIENNEVATIEEVYERYKKELGEKVARKVKALYGEVEEMGK